MLGEPGGRFASRLEAGMSGIVLQSYLGVNESRGSLGADFCLECLVCENE